MRILKKSTQKIPFNSAQDIQDEIFKKMSADRKVKLGVGLWRLAKELDRNKVMYGGYRSKRFINTNSRNS